MCVCMHVCVPLCVCVCVCVYVCVCVCLCERECVSYFSPFVTLHVLGTSLKHREVKHFGYEFKYSINNVDPSEPLPEGIPEQCHQLLQEAVDRNIVSHFPDQLTVNRYLPGQGTN